VKAGDLTAATAATQTRVFHHCNSSRRRGGLVQWLATDQQQV